MILSHLDYFNKHRQLFKEEDKNLGSYLLNVIRNFQEKYITYLHVLCIFFILCII